jgi:2-oxo-4-hydroxy-4-carboxy-5-ureidoimidazoline decarboxylase
MTLDALNAAGEASFVATLGGIFEHSPWVAARAWPERPFATVADLHAAMCRAVARATRDEQLGLIVAHPDLVGRAALAGSLTPASRDEQAAAGLDRLSPDEIAAFGTLNAVYRARFGFPFVICVREHRKAAILAGLRSRVKNAREAEIATALGEIEKIARLRLEATVRA